MWFTRELAVLGGRSAPGCFKLLPASIKGTDMTNFSIDFVSPPTFDSLAVEVSFCSQLLCRIDRERQDGALEVEFFHLARALGDEVTMKLSLAEFLQVVEHASAELLAIPPASPPREVPAKS